MHGKKGMSTIKTRAQTDGGTRSGGTISGRRRRGRYGKEKRGSDLQLPLETSG